PLKPGEIDVAQIKCGKLDDLGVALIGTHPRDVWLTRLESALPRAALADDLQIQASSGQSPVQNWVVAQQATNNPCPPDMVPPPGARHLPRSGPGRAHRDLFMFGAAIAAMLLAISRRAGRAIARQGRLAPARVDG